MKGEFIIFSYWVGAPVCNPTTHNEAYSIKESRRNNSMVYSDAIVISVDELDSYVSKYFEGRKRDFNESDFHGN